MLILPVVSKYLFTCFPSSQPLSKQAVEAKKTFELKKNMNLLFQVDFVLDGWSEYTIDIKTFLSLSVSLSLSLLLFIYMIVCHRKHLFSAETFKLVIFILLKRLIYKRKSVEYSLNCVRTAECLLIELIIFVLKWSRSQYTKLSKTFYSFALLIRNMIFTGVGWIVSIGELILYQDWHWTWMTNNRRRTSSLKMN